jgi:hypothetical protein
VVLGRRCGKGVGWHRHQQHEGGRDNSAKRKGLNSCKFHIDSWMTFWDIKFRFFEMPQPGAKFAISPMEHTASHSHIERE